MHTHTHSHMGMHAHTRAHSCMGMHECSHAHSHMLNHTHTAHSCTFTCSLTHNVQLLMCSHTHTHSYTLIYSHTYPVIHIHTYTVVYMYSYSYPLSYAPTVTLLHTLTHKSHTDSQGCSLFLMHTHTSIYTRSLAHMLPLQSQLLFLGVCSLKANWLSCRPEREVPLHSGPAVMALDLFGPLAAPELGLPNLLCPDMKDKSGSQLLIS